MANPTFEYLVRTKFNKSSKQMLQELAEKDYTRQMAAEYVDCSISTINRHAKDNGISFRSISPSDRQKHKKPDYIEQSQPKLNSLLSKKWV